MLLIFVTSDTFHAEISLLKKFAAPNKPAIFTTLDVSHELISWLKVGLLFNI